MNQAILPPEILVDRLCGPIRTVHRFPVYDGQPSSFLCDVADVADMRRVGSWPADRIAAGTSFGDPQRARMAAIGEAVERYCGNLIPHGLTRASATELESLGTDHFRATELPAFASWQYDRQPFAYRRFDPSIPIEWAEGNVQGRRCLIPAALVYCNWYRSRQREAAEQRTFHLNYSGIATGDGTDDARRRGLLETVERDAVTLWWGLGLPAIGIRPESVKGLSEQWAGTRLTLELVSIPVVIGSSVTAPVSVIAALVRDETLGLAGAGFACRHDVHEAARKAALEAVQVWLVQRGLMDENGPSLAAAKAGVLAAGSYLPHRSDRRYLDDAGSDFASVRDLAMHGQLWLDERLHHLLERFRPIQIVDADELNSLATVVHDESTAVEALEESLAASGHRVLDVDLTTSDIARTNLRVSRVVVGGLLPNGPAAYTYYGNPRWMHVARTFGLLSAEATDDDLRSVLTLAPPPHL